MRTALGLATILASFTLSCAHVNKVGFDNTTNTVTLCGNKWADQGDINSAAKSACGGGARPALLRCNMVHDGAVATSNTDPRGRTSTNIKPVYKNCCEYQCNGPVAEGRY
jgi:hypothetical protein